MSEIEKYKELLFSKKTIEEIPVSISKSHLATTNKKKVVVLSKVSIDSGAGGTRIANIVDLLDRSFLYETSAYVFSENKKYGDVINKNGQSRFVALEDYSPFKGIQKYKRLFFNKKVIRNILDTEKPDIIIIYSVLTFRNIRFIKKYAKKHRIKLFFDVVESRKLLTSLSPFAFFGYNLHNFLINHHYINKKTDGVICPTFFLKDFFVKKRKCKNIFVFPITMNIDSLPKYSKDNQIDRIVFLYAGNPTRKRDLIANTIKGFNLLPKELKKRILFLVCGPSAQNLIEKEGLSKEEYEKSLQFTLYFGRLSKANLYSLYPNIDYTVLLKNPNKQFSKAGFPTKMTESFSCAIPMVANLSGDMSYYMIDGENSFVSKSTSPKAFSLALTESIMNYKDKHTTLSKNALLTAREKLDNSVYVDVFVEFLNK